MSPPELFETADEAKAALPYEDYRIWWASHIGRPVPGRGWKRRKIKPAPGVYDLADEELG